MTVMLNDFSAYFAALNGVHPPFAWQVRLLRSIVDTGRWPDQIAAPTGSGKSNVVDVHVFVNALAACGEGPRVPRRLATVVDRRALVDSQFERANQIAERLRAASPADSDDVLWRVAEALRHQALQPDTPVRTQNLRGGLGQEIASARQLREESTASDADGTVWIDDPVTCTVISATPDMWGSRLLFRGYGSRRGARPREAGLLALDAAIVLDEAHLSRQLLATARRIADLTAHEAERIGVPNLQVVETTATPDTSAGVSVGVQPEDVESDPVLAARLMRHKPVRVIRANAWPGKTKSKEAHIAQLADETSALVGTSDGVVGCLVNRVDTAVGVAETLRKQGLRVACWVGRRRPADVRQLVAEHAVLFDPDAEQTLDVLVATQTVEVGVDIDLAALVTELAPGSAIAQRVGRVNRRGRRDEGPIVIVAPDVVTSDVPPYAQDELEASLGWLRELPDANLSPWNLRENPAPASTLRRGLIKRPERYDAARWAVTSTPMLADETLDLWLADDLASDTEPCSIVVRGPLPNDDNQAVGLLKATMPTPDEAFPVTIGLARRVMLRILTGEAGPQRRAWVLRDDNVVPLAVEKGRRQGGPDAVIVPALRPGDVVVVPTGLALTVEGVVSEDASTAEPFPTWWGAALDVLVRDHASAREIELFRELDDALPDEAPQLVVDAWMSWHGAGGGPLQATLATPDERGLIQWVAIQPGAAETDDTRQVWTPSGQRVELSAHCEAVRQLARQLVDNLALADESGSMVEQGALWHDAGKADARFQRSLGAATGDPLWAKSGMRSAQQMRLAHRQNLPAGWRHEFRSAALAWAALDGLPHRAMVTRLAGTSHGHGRGVPTAIAQLASADGDPAMACIDELFHRGRWDALMHDTHREWGIWGCAYLEALVRAADCVTSKEGR